MPAADSYILPSPHPWEFATELGKRATVASYVNLMFSRTSRMFKYTNLPETIPQNYLERYLQTRGQCCITKVNGKLYALLGGIGDEPSPYYFGTKYIAANPALKFSAEMEIGKECVLCKNDTLMNGLLHLNERYATLLAENDLTMKISDINHRIPVIAALHRDNDTEGFRAFMKAVEDGSIGNVVADGFEEAFSVFPYSDTKTNLTDYIEFHQYVKGAWYNELGLRASFNMKREALSESELGANDDTLIPLIDDMYDCRKEFVEEVNALYGTNISVSRDSVWKRLDKEMDMQEELLESEIEKNEESNRIDKEGSEKDDSEDKTAESPSDESE